MNTYTKLKDETWGVRVQGTATVGQSVTVTKKDGSTKTETIKAVLWTGADKTSGKTISLCSVSQSSRGTRRLYPGMMCPGCGSEPLDNNLSCWECGFSGD